MQNKIIEMILDYEELEEELLKKMVLSWESDEIIAWHRVQAKREVLDYLLTYLLEGENNG